MRQWWLQVCGYRQISSKIVSVYERNGDNYPTKHRTEILYEKHGRYKIVKLRGAWDI